MTISSTTRKAGPFIGNGSASSFPFTFKVFQASDLLVVQLDTTFDVESTLVLNTNYTVSLNANQNTNPGGTVTLSAGALAAGYTLTITSDIDNLQPTDLTNQGGFYPTVINDALDRATIQIQQLQVESDRSIKVPVSSTVGTDLPTPQANDLLGWNGDASALVNINASTLATVAAYATAYADTFTADGTTVNWTLTRDPATINNLDVSIDGVTQVPNVDYTLSGTTFSTTSTVPSGRVILVKYREGLPNMSADSQDVRYVPAGTGAVTTTVQAKLRETVSVKDFGAVGDGSDSTLAIQAAVDAIRAAGGGTVYVPEGTYLISTTIDLYQGSAVNIVVKGAARGATNFTTTADIVVFSHAENCVFQDFTITQAGTAKTGRAFSTPTNKQAAYCVYERLAVNSFKYGIWWRYSLWCSVRDVRFNSCGVGVKGSRNAFPDDQTNPVAPGGWNADPGFFHNQNNFTNVLCNGGEAGIWGVFHTTVFDTVTCQGQTGDGSANTVIPVGTKGVGLWLESGSGSSTFGSTGNQLISYYSEFSRQPLIFDYANVGISGGYIQGRTTGDPSEQPIKASNCVVQARGGVISFSDYFKYTLVLVNATAYGQVAGGSFTVSQYSIDATSNYYGVYGSPAVVNKQFNHTGAATTVVKTMTNRRNYSVKVSGIYDGSSVRGAAFEVQHYQSGFSKVLTVTGSSADVTCTVSGNDIEINTTGSLSYALYCTVVDNSQLGQIGVF